MGFLVPSRSDVPFRDQAEVDSEDFRALGHRATGILSGGVVSAQAVPAMSVQVTAGAAVIAGTTHSWTGKSVLVQPADSSPRFDLVVAGDDDDLHVVRGAPSTNPAFPGFDPATQALLAVMFVRGGADSVIGADIVRKDIIMEPSFRRPFTADDSVFLSTTAPSGGIEVQADGRMAWGSNVLRRTAATAMELVTALTLKAASGVSSVLTVYARNTNPAEQKVLDVRSYSDQPLASVSGTGVLTAANFKRGTGSPESSVVGNKGDLYIDETGSATEMVWIKVSNTGANTGWLPLKITAAGDEVFPTGTLVMIMGGTAPDGWVSPTGQSISTTDPATADLAALVGTTYGSGPGFVDLPDLRGVFLVGSGGPLSFTLGDFVGSAAQQLSIANIPQHVHDVEDPGHQHPQWARMLTYAPTGGTHPDGPAGWSVQPEPTGFSRRSETDVKVLPAGGSEPLPIIPPAMAGTWIVKL